MPVSDSFNPHPHRGTGAAGDTIYLEIESEMFQSSPAPRYGCCAEAPAKMLKAEKFQSSPAPRYGCCNGLLRHKSAMTMFQSSPAPRYGCCCGLPVFVRDPVGFQSSPAPRYGCCCTAKRNVSSCKSFNPHPHRGTGAAISIYPISQRWSVSILTRTEVRVLRKMSDREMADIAVSILTRTEVRVLLATGTTSVTLTHTFQSSPAPRYGCCTTRVLAKS